MLSERRQIDAEGFFLQSVFIPLSSDLISSVRSSRTEHLQLGQRGRGC